jgi:hypothetical protein
MGWLKKAFSAVRSVTGGIASAIQGVASAAGSAVSNLASTARGITGAVYDQIGALAQKIGNTVEAIASNPKMLAAVAVNFAFPGAGAAIGEWILGAETAATLGAAATTAVGNACLNTAMNGGDMKKGIETAVTSYVGNVGGQELAKYVQNATDVPDQLAKNIGTTTSYAAIQAAMGKDPTTALLTGGANACAQLLTQQVPGFSDMPKDVQAAVTKATASALQGKSGGAVNAAIDYATNFAKDEYKSYKDANDNGFGYDANAWKDAKTIGITDPKDYQYAKSIGADNPYDLQIGKNVGAKDNLDLTLARDTGVNTADDLNYAKQVGVNNKDDFTLAKDLGIKDSTDFNLAKAVGVDNVDDFKFAKTVGANTAQDFDLAKNIGVKNSDEFNLAKALGVDNSKDFNYAKVVGATTAEDLGIANQIGAKDSTDLNVAKQFGITDKDTFNKYSDFLGHGTEKASTSTIHGADGTELTVDNEGNLVKYTYEGEQGQQDITDEVAKVAKRSGGYTLRGDDGSTITVNEDGTVSATDAPDDTSVMPGAKKPAVSYAKLLGTAAKNRAVTQKTEQGGVNEATAKATQLARSGQRELTTEDLMGLLELMGGGDQQYYTPTAAQESGESQLAQIEPTGPSNEDINFLGNLGGRSSYLGSLERGDLTGDGQVEPGKDAGAGSKGATFGPPVGAGGGGAGFDRYTSSGPVVGGGGGAGYGRSSTGDIYKTLQSVGLQDQSDAETQRLLNAQGPVAVGRMPPSRPAGTPTPAAAPAAPAALAAVDQTATPATGSIDEVLKQLQGYAGAAGAVGSDTASSLLKYLLASGSKPKGTEAYKDMFGNIRTR